MKGAATESGRAHCPVCCGDLDLQVVFCARCATPHHGECWQFTGVCAIYACGSGQFTETEAGPEDELVVLDDPETPPRPTPRPTRNLPVPAASLPAQRPEGEVAQLAQSKRAAFRHWLRELLDEGLTVPRLWSGAPVVKRRMRLPEQEHEAESVAETRGLVWVLLGMLPIVFLLVILGQPSWWVAFEVVAYLGLIGALHYVSTPFHRELIVDSTQRVGSSGSAAPPGGGSRTCVRCLPWRRSRSWSKGIPEAVCTPAWYCWTSSGGRSRFPACCCRCRATARRRTPTCARRGRRRGSWG